MTLKKPKVVNKVSVKKKKTTKKSPTKKRFKSKYDYTSLLNDLKQEDYKRPMEELTKLIPHDIRKDLILNLISSSRFRAYSLAMKKFLFVCKSYRQSKDIVMVEAYIKELREINTNDMNFYSFINARIYFLKDMLKDDSSKAFISLISIHDEDVYGDSNKAVLARARCIDTIASLAEAVWKGKGEPIKVLYGK